MSTCTRKCCQTCSYETRRHCIKNERNIKPVTGYTRCDDWKERTEKNCYKIEGDEYGNVLLYIPEKAAFLKIEVGNGEQLLKEDYENGYVAYLDLEIADSNGNIDGGILMLTEKDVAEYKYFRRRLIKEALLEMCDKAYSYIEIKKDALKAINSVM